MKLKVTLAESFSERNVLIPSHSTNRDMIGMHTESPFNSADNCWTFIAIFMMIYSTFVQCMDIEQEIGETALPQKITNCIERCLLFLKGQIVVERLCTYKT